MLNALQLLGSSVISIIIIVTIILLPAVVVAILFIHMLLFDDFILALVNGCRSILVLFRSFFREIGCSDDSLFLTEGIYHSLSYSQSLITL